MKTGVWQPYFFPYIGYFQVVNLVDTFVFFDDANFIKRGYIHRNKIHSTQGELQFSIPLKNASQNQIIGDVCVADTFQHWQNRFLKTLVHCYGRSKFWSQITPMVEKSLENRRINEISQTSIVLTCDYLGIDTNFTKSSKIEYNHFLSPSQKVSEIAFKTNADCYINTEYGRSIYDINDFSAKGIKLLFQRPDLESLTRLFNGNHWTYSILHLLYNFSPDKIRQSMNLQTLID